MHPSRTAEPFSAALPALQHALAQAGDAAAPQEERLLGAHAFAESLGDCLPLLAGQGERLIDLLAFVEMQVNDLAVQDATQAAETCMLIHDLLALLEAHLDAPDDPEVIEALLDIATSQPLETPLDPEVAAAWRTVQTEQAHRIAAPELDPGTMVVPDNGDAARLSDDAAEMCALLGEAIEDSQALMRERADAIARADDPRSRARAAHAARETLGRFADASLEIGFSAFAACCRGLAARLEAMPNDRPWPLPLLARLTQLPLRLLDYARHPFALDCRTALVDVLRDPLWPMQLGAAEADTLIAGLYQDLLSLERDRLPERATRIAPEDLALTPSEDIDAGVLDSFRLEGPDMALGLARAIQAIVREQGGEEALRQAQRYAHTLKGSANICGVRAVAVLSHHLEDLLDFLAARQRAPTPALGETLMGAADTLALMFDMLRGIEPPDPASLLAGMQAVLDWANRIDREGLDALEWIPDAPQARAGALLDTALEAREPPLASAPREDEETYVQVPSRAIDDLLRLVGEQAIALSHSEQKLSQAQRLLRESEALDQRNLTHLGALETLVDLRGLGIHQPMASAGLDASQPRDPLELEQYNEMYIATRRLNEGVSDARELDQALEATLRQLDELARQQIKLNQQIRHFTMRTRLVEAGSIAPRLQRAVRQTCRDTGKEAELSLRGGDVRVDSHLLDRLMPALMHLVRNAIDHGIESPEERAATDKPRQGRVEIHFHQSGDQIAVTIADDGRGLDLTRVRHKAIDQGLIAETAELSDQELALLTLRPGFSTRDQVTQVSGRGVGMDVVANTIRSLNGTLAIDAEPGRGYRLTARLPASLLTLYCLLIQCGEQWLAIPANEVRQALLADEGEIVEDADGWRFQHAGRSYPLDRLDQLLGLAASPRPRRRDVVLLTRSPSGDRAVVVDVLHEGRELVMMKLGPLVPRIPGLMAASIHGDGRVLPIVELGAILRLASGQALSAAVQEEAAEPLRPATVLIVDDSLSMRRALSQLVADSGYRALTARDGMDAIQTMTQDQVDLLLIDMEMPRMNGLELAAHLRAQPATRALPIAMISSRSLEKHRREALQSGVDHYFVKPCREDEIQDFIQRSIEARAVPVAA